MRLNVGAHLFLTVDGYGRLSLGMIQALMRNGHEVYPFELGSLNQKPAWFLRAQHMDFSVPTVQLAPPHNFHHLPGRSISYTMHESMTLPRGWADHVNEKSQVLCVPSPWLIEVFTEAGVQIPIEVVPGGISPDECTVMGQNCNRPFTFGCLADRGMRKGFDKVWMAFYKAFDFKNKDVRLLIKCRPGSLPFLDFAYSSDPRMTIWRADIPNVADVYSQMDAYVCPARCEGYGMSPREAAACGIPTVVIRWSGTADDTDQWAIPLEKYDLIESHMDDCGGLWAEPDLDEIVENMRWLYQHQDEAKERALKAAQWMRDNQTYQHSAQKLVDVMSRHLGYPQ